MPQRGSIPVIGRPRSRIWPDVGWVNPANMLRRVDLPQPEAPIRQRNSPSLTSSERFCSATSPSPPAGKALVTRSAVRMPDI